MIDQYIYSRADGTKESMMNHIGFGLMYYTEGIVPIQKGISDISYYVGEITDRDNKRIEIIAKRQIPRCEGKTALYLSKLIEPEKQRGFLHCHGYVMDTSDEAVLNPDIWFYQKFINCNVNENDVSLSQCESLLENSTPLWPLKDLLERVNLTIDEFASVVCSCIDARNTGTAVFVSVDFSQDDIRELSAQLIRWVFHLLPFSMRRQAGFSTCYDDNCIGGDFTLVLVPSSIVVERGKKPFIKARKQPSSVSYLYAMGQLVHINTPKYQEFGESGKIYHMWLNQVIRTIYGQSYEESLDTLSVLDEIYSYFDSLTASLPEEDQIREKYLNAVCWIYQVGEEYKGRRVAGCESLIPELEDEPEYIEGMLDFSESDEMQKELSLILNKSMAACRNGISEFWIHILCRIRKMGWSVSSAIATTVLNAYLARWMDDTQLGKKWDCFEKFCSLCLDSCEPKELGTMMEYMFFPDSLDADSTIYWEKAGVSCDSEMGDQRAADFLKERFDHADELSKILLSMSEWLGLIEDFSEDHVDLLIGTLNDVVDTIHLESVEMAVSGLALICLKEWESIRKYPASKESLEYIYGRIATEAYKKCKANNRGNLVEEIREWNSHFERIADNPYARNMWRSKFQEVIGKVNNAEKMSDLKTILIPEDGLFQWACTNTVNAEKLNINEQECEFFFIQNCRILMAETEKVVPARDWFLNFDKESPYPLKRLCTEVPDESVITISVLRDFIEEDNYSYESLYKQMNRAEQSFAITHAKLEPRCLKILFQMFGHRKFDDLGIDILERIYLVLFRKKVEESMQDQTHAQYYKSVMEIKGGSALLELLDMYPSAPKGEAEDVDEPDEVSASRKLISGFASRFLSKRGDDEEEEIQYVKKKGRYKWLKIDDSLLNTVQYLVQNETFLNEVLRENELFSAHLIQMIDTLTPEGSTMEKKGAALKKEIYRLCKDAKLLTGNAQKAMKSLKKNGIL